jgi:hypothetical protein
VTAISIHFRYDFPAGHSGLAFAPLDLVSWIRAATNGK